MPFFSCLNERNIMSIWRPKHSSHMVMCFVFTHPLAADLLQFERVRRCFLRVPVDTGTEQHFPRQRRLRIATLTDAGQRQFAVLFDRHENVASVQTP